MVGLHPIVYTTRYTKILVDSVFSLPPIKILCSHEYLGYSLPVAKNEKRPRGRPRTGRLRVLLKLKPETDKLLYRMAGKEGITKSEFVERAIQERVERYVRAANISKE